MLVMKMTVIDSLLRLQNVLATIVAVHTVTTHPGNVCVIHLSMDPIAIDACPQCHQETGQCACMPGSTGSRCEACQHGYWNYGPFGCKKCDCEADLSLGTVCDAAADVLDRVEVATWLLSKISMFGVKSMSDGIEKDEQAINAAIGEIETLNRATGECTDLVTTLKKTIGNLLNELNYTMSVFEERINEKKRFRRSAAYTNRVRELEAEAARLSGMFGAARLEAENAVEAANAYKELLAVLKEAREFAQNASKNANEAKEFIVGQAANAKIAKKESGNLLRSASDARKVTVNEIALLRSSIEQKGGKLKQNIDEQKARIDALRGMFDDGEMEKADQSEIMSEETKERIDKVTSSINDIQPELDEFVNKTT
uniref:Laminin EGF-like domain-containing protein n=1 Tax=Parascaris equorum TaxID=6256 RepID=A0A914RFH2_PAREQ